MHNYAFDEQGLIRFLTAIVDGSIGIDVYSVLLGKPDRYSSGRESMSIEEKREQDYGKLASYAWDRISEELELTDAVIPQAISA